VATADLQLSDAPSPAPFNPPDPSAGGDQRREKVKKEVTKN